MPVPTWSEEKHPENYLIETTHISEVYNAASNNIIRMAYAYFAVTPCLVIYEVGLCYLLFRLSLGLTESKRKSHILFRCGLNSTTESFLIYLFISIRIDQHCMHACYANLLRNTKFNGEFDFNSHVPHVTTLSF